MGCAAIVALSGCSRVTVHVDARIAPEATMGGTVETGRLFDASYAVLGADEHIESSLAFRDYSELWRFALGEAYPSMQRVDTSARADLLMTLSYTLVDLGTGVRSYPVYRSHLSYIGMCRGQPVYARRRYYAGTRTETYHLGYEHSVFVSAWVPDEAYPAGRMTLWEGAAATVLGDADLDGAMPYLMVALSRYYGLETEDDERIHFDRDDDAVVMLEQAARPPRPLAEVPPPPAGYNPSTAQ
jgi:hypothetical protein